MKYTFDTKGRPFNRADEIVHDLLAVYIEHGKDSCARRFNEIVTSLEKFNKKGKQTAGISAMEGAVIRSRLRNALKENGVNL